MQLSRRRLVQLSLGLSAASVVGLSACANTNADQPAASSTPSAAGAFPVTIEHAFGSTTIESVPQRVLTIGFNEQDFALAFGVEPIGVREFLGYDAPKRPWAPESVRGKAIPTVGANELDFEKIAGLAPDLILGVNSYIDQAAYTRLAAIANTVAEPKGAAQGSTSWSDQTMITARALGQEAKGQELVATVRQAFDDAKAANAGFAGKSASFLLGVSTKGTYALGRDDYRTGWLTDLGFTVPATGGEVSLERLDTVDADVVLAEGVEAGMLDNRVFTALPAVAEGRFVDFGGYDQDFAAALGFNSPLSLPFALQIALPRLAAVTDADPATTPAPYPG